LHGQSERLGFVHGIKAQELSWLGDDTVPRQDAKMRPHGCGLQFVSWAFD
jgi:hypothetical protein